jgi:hypothetical protein
MIIFAQILNNIMLLQEILVFTLFIGAIGFIGFIFWKSLNAESNNRGNCASCSVKDMKKIQGQFIKHQRKK